MSIVPMSVLMLGASYGYAPSYLGAASITLTSAEIGDRNASEMAARVNYYMTLPTGAYDRTRALQYASSDYDKAHAVTSKGTAAWDEAKALIRDNPKLADLSAWASFASALMGKGYTQDDVNKMMAAVLANKGFSLEANMPWIIMAGAALLAVVLLMGTRKR